MICAKVGKWLKIESVFTLICQFIPIIRCHAMLNNLSISSSIPPCSHCGQLCSAGIPPVMTIAHQITLPGSAALCVRGCKGIFKLPIMQLISPYKVSYIWEEIINEDKSQAFCFISLSGLAWKKCKQTGLWFILVDDFRSELPLNTSDLVR